MSKEALSDELRQVERQLIDGEQRLAEYEARILERKRSGQTPRRLKQNLT